jgi:hypothetical protein
MCQYRAISRAVFATVFTCFGLMICVISVARADDPQSGITHGLMATGAETYIRDGEGTITWRYPHSTRDGWLLPSGNILLTFSKSNTYPGGGVVEIQKDGKIVFEYKGTQAEVNTAQAIDGQRILISEAGDNPRLLEVDRNGRILIEVPLKAQVKEGRRSTRPLRQRRPEAIRPDIDNDIVDETLPRWGDGRNLKREYRAAELTRGESRLPDRRLQ